MQEVELINGDDATPINFHHDGETPPNFESETAVEATNLKTPQSVPVSNVPP